MNEQTSKTQPATRASGKHPRGFCFSDRHVEFICREIAEFRARPASRLVDACMAAFPDFPPVAASRRRHWWADHIGAAFPRDFAGQITDRCRHRARIDELRELWRRTSSDALLIANRRGRLEMLQQCFNKAVETGQLRDAAYILHLAEREAGESELPDSPQFEINFTDAKTDDQHPAVPAPAPGN
ncbi:hypothetical protein GX586_16055 [bacterium]|nr:hypothetical protein [bacterium]